ncbi:hypothetical protein BCR41DRAFT_326119, partial [Lobosporangium transversale]
MILNLRSRTCNYIQMMMGLFLFSTGTQRKVIEVLSAAGFSVSYASILNGLNSLTEGAMKKVQSVVKDKSWFLLYDNINFASQKYDQRATNRDSFENGTTATIVECPDINVGPVVNDPYRLLTLNSLVPTAGNQRHFEDSYRFHVKGILQRYLSRFEGCSNPAPISNRIATTKTATYPLPAMKIDESTIEGNKSIIDTVMHKKLCIQTEWFRDNYQIIIAGDLFTVSRIRSLKRYSRDEVS